MASSAGDRRKVRQLRAAVPEDPILARLRRLESENGLVLSWADLLPELGAVLRAADEARPLIMLGGTDSGTALTFTLIHQGQKLRWYMADLDYARLILESVAGALAPTGGDQAS